MNGLGGGGQAQAALWGSPRHCPICPLCPPSPQMGGCSAEHADLVLHTVLHYCARRQRWGTAITFFAR